MNEALAADRKAFLASFGLAGDCSRKCDPDLRPQSNGRATPRSTARHAEQLHLSIALATDLPTAAMLSLIRPESVRLALHFATFAKFCDQPNDQQEWGGILTSAKAFAFEIVEKQLKRMPVESQCIKGIAGAGGQDALGLSPPIHRLFCRFGTKFAPAQVQSCNTRNPSRGWGTLAFKDFSLPPQATFSKAKALLNPITH